MYCVKCGVELHGGEQECPLCKTAVLYHPEVERSNAERSYPSGRFPVRSMRPTGWLIVATVLAVLAMMITFICDLRIGGTLTWAGYVIGALVLLYVIAVLPYWFRRPNPVIFVPVGFVVTGLYLLYIDLAVEGGWFMSFAFPVVGTVGLITTAVVALVRYIRKGHLYIYGGALIALGGFMLLLEYLLSATFDMDFYYWSIFPLIVFSLLGFWLIFLAIHKPTRETIKRKFFY